MSVVEFSFKAMNCTLQ